MVHTHGVRGLNGTGGVSLGRGVIPYTTKGMKALARLMRAEAVGDGPLGELMVANTGVNRVIADCYNFEEITTLLEMIYQQPGGFEAVHHNFFYQRARQKEINLAKKALKGRNYHPASYALYFYAPPEGATCREQWFGAWNAGRYKSHCFYQPTQGECPQLW